MSSSDTPPSADQVKAVTIRELSRRTTALLLTVEQGSSRLIVCRRGQPVAVIIPVPDRLEIGKIDWNPSAGEHADDASDEPLPEIDAYQRHVLDQIVAFGEPWSFERLRGDVNLNIGTMVVLQLEGLVEKKVGGRYVPTALGMRLAQAG